MSEDKKHELIHREILAAYITVLDQPEKLLEACLNAVGGMVDARLAVEKAFGFSTVAADAVLSMQIQRFTPLERNRIQDELAALDASLA
ncbi:hypothetical protein [Rathayibacter sp. VKM Ac-2760]|uniref:hypothetical protein n=1 Tax=Rathayibacter sp. VKM Ac-2760 TaxID=2609253 RepID=UPI0013199F9B|nr:hypothetical protein [Rathayibacter sp. VKM Ac-2760]QHC61221.1 hypothetical protein GSU72_21105 [Rathayibacter sp. VKM Ac-2760]